MLISKKRLDFLNWEFEQEDSVIWRLVAFSGLQSMCLKILKLSRSAKGVTAWHNSALKKGKSKYWICIRQVNLK